jgi:hypothetical protein
MGAVEYRQYGVIVGPSLNRLTPFFFFFLALPHLVQLTIRRFGVCAANVGVLDRGVLGTTVDRQRRKKVV